MLKITPKFTIAMIIAAFGIFFIYNLRLGWVVNDNEFVEASIDGNEITLEVVSSAEKKVNGLSGKPYIDDNYGMLFSYSRTGKRSFWMNEMNFPIDIIWVEDGIVVGVSQNVEVYDEAGEVTQVEPDIYSDQVIEVAAGYCERYGIEVGDEIVF